MLIQRCVSVYLYARCCRRHQCGVRVRDTPAHISRTRANAHITDNISSYISPAHAFAHADPTLAGVDAPYKPYTRDNGDNSERQCQRTE